MTTPKGKAARRNFLNPYWWRPLSDGSRSIRLPDLPSGSGFVFHDRYPWRAIADQMLSAAKDSIWGRSPLPGDGGIDCEPGEIKKSTSRNDGRSVGNVNRGSQPSAASSAGALASAKLLGCVPCDGEMYEVTYGPEIPLDENWEPIPIPTGFSENAQFTNNDDLPHFERTIDTEDRIRTLQKTIHKDRDLSARLSAWMGRPHQRWYGSSAFSTTTRFAGLNRSVRSSVMRDGRSVDGLKQSAQYSRELLKAMFKPAPTFAAQERQNYFARIAEELNPDESTNAPMLECCEHALPCKLTTTVESMMYGDAFDETVRTQPWSDLNVRDFTTRSQPAFDPKAGGFLRFYRMKEFSENMKREIDKLRAGLNKGVPVAICIRVNVKCEYQPVREIPDPPHVRDKTLDPPRERLPSGAVKPPIQKVPG